VRRLPRRLVLALGSGLGRVWGALDARHLRVAADNLRQAFPDWDEARVQATAHGVYAHFGAVILDLCWMAGRPADELSGTRRPRRRRAPAERARRRTRRRLAFRPPRQLGDPGRGFRAEGRQRRHDRAPARQPGARPRLNELRTSTGNTVIYKQKALAQVIQTIRSGGIVAILIDQNMQAKDGSSCASSAGRRARRPSAAALALKTGCAIVPVRCLLQKNGRYRMVYGPPVDWPRSGRKDEDVAALTQHLTSIIEGWVRETPEQWLWLHRRWKTRPSLEASSSPGLEGSTVSSASPAVPPSSPSPTVQPVSVAPPPENRS
jgi:KDO2-lipid IV(A) lauroyltransferase